MVISSNSQVIEWTLLYFQASAEANKITGKLKRHNLKIQSKKAVVEYTRGVDDKQKATMNANANTNANTNTNNNAVLVEGEFPESRGSHNSTAIGETRSIYRWYRQEHV